MDPTIFDRIGLPLLNKHGITVLKYLAFWQGLYMLAHPFSSYVSASYRRLEPNRQADWCTRIVSSVHAALVCYAACNMLGDPELARDKVFGYTDYACWTTCVACGYFIWDTLISAYLIDVYGPSFLIHGFLCLMVFVFAFKPFLMYFAAPFLLFELSTPFLNVNWFCDKLGMTGSILQLANGVMLMISFFCVRLVYGVYNVYDFFRSVLSQREKVAPHLILIYGTASITLTVLNFYWFYRIFDAVRRRFVGASPPKKHQRSMQNSDGKAVKDE
ncbi:hypothetical protein SeMB42_g04075 [Synchytrium endobioticum]|uniref:TLC domain-containing protein n=1 Tax=Synchytrium endobioticum TaxID=286115 RepID=A0A507D1C6_9FUNG|nr:hypothetical protein SeMB42_g04075 [Synchytrium endobioticum]TPX46214.1 hypothetical protein SeLEV6574_g03346 [Synchytrium endobioticum]